VGCSVLGHEHAVSSSRVVNFPRAEHGCERRSKVGYRACESHEIGFPRHLLQAKGFADSILPSQPCVLGRKTHLLTTSDLTPATMSASLSFAGGGVPISPVMGWMELVADTVSGVALSFSCAYLSSALSCSLEMLRRMLPACIALMRANCDGRGRFEARDPNCVVHCCVGVAHCVYDTGRAAGAAMDLARRVAPLRSMFIVKVWVYWSMKLNDEVEDERNAGGDGMRVGREDER
jgi:hypothetical protein